MNRRAGVRVVLISLAIAGCAPKTAPTGGPAAGADLPGLSAASTSADIHTALLNPASNTLYAAESDPPATAEGWAAVEAAAARIIDGARLMQTGLRSQGRADWVRISRLVEEAATRAAEAGRMQDADMLAAADGDFTAQCEDCHNAFRDAAGGGMMSEPGH